MANGVDSAIATATRLEEIGFPEFTTKLVSDVFDSLIAANLRQQEAYIELLQATAKSLKDFINDTKDDIGPEELLQFLSATVPPTDPGPDSPPTKVATGETLTAADRDALNSALAVPADAAITDDNKVADTGSLTEPKVNAIMDAVAIRIAANKYTLLQEMVKQGLLRLVVEDGVIKTRLNFRTYGSDYFSRNARNMHRDTFAFRAKAKSGGFVSLWVKAQASTSYTSINVSTVDTKTLASTRTNIDIFGEVTINFRTDYLPLDQT
jgi:hypothetical protein